ncbi:hypothetical protein CMQ_8271 [Grosmannia clavigera kw1407]|uniref:Uncharacterized protein n=1 Tax=Grosmannia clavigera (strain kw1407 / UAMH 11150) TaxID=655863 RepID=F0XKI7_GROCL|nr:uncharacterized protein CMQ_8271 [Grosmannia clavigera kw1407]EFX01805.1 hypothetical protein CMQ_8271 [Grosmannia clavigera kw1407]
MQPTLRELFNSHATEPPGQASMTSQTNSRLPSMYRPQQQHHPFETHPSPQANSGASDVLRLPQINMLKEPPAPLSTAVRTPVAFSGFRHENRERRLAGGSDESSGAGRSTGRGRGAASERRAGSNSSQTATTSSSSSSRSSGHTPESIAAHTAAAQRSVANSGQPKFVHSPTRSGGRLRSSLSSAQSSSRMQFKKTAAHRKTASSVAAAKAAAAKAEMLSNVSYTIDKADGTSMTFSRRNVFETFDISPAALQANATAMVASSSSSSRPRLVGNHAVFRASPPQPSAAFSRAQTAMGYGGATMQSPPTSRAVQALPPLSAVQPRLRSVVPLPSASQLQAQQPPSDDESLVLPPITNHGSILADTPRFLTLQPSNQVGPVQSLGRSSQVARPVNVVFPLVVPSRSPEPGSGSGSGWAQSSQRLNHHDVYQSEAALEIVPLDRRGSVNLMTVPAGIRALEQDGGEAKRFLLPDHEPRLKPHPGRSSYGFQMETFQRTSRKQYQQQRHRMHQQRYRQRQQLQQQQKRLQQVQRHQEEQKRLREEQEQPEEQEQYELAAPVTQPQGSQPHQPQSRLQYSEGVFVRSALPPQVLGGEVALDDMPQVHIVRVGTVHPPFEPLQPPVRGNIPGFLLLPSKKDGTGWLQKSATASYKCSTAAEDGHQERQERTYVLVSAAEALRLNEELAAAVGSSSSSNSSLIETLRSIVPHSGVTGSGDEALTRMALQAMQKMAGASLSPSASTLPNEYDEEITGRSITLAICILVQQQQPGAQHALDLREIHCTISSDGAAPPSISSFLSSASPSSSPTSAFASTTSPLFPHGLASRVMIPNVVGRRLSASVAGTSPSTVLSGQLEPGEKLEIPRLTIILSDHWSSWTVSCSVVSATKVQNCLAAPEVRDHLQPDHYDGRILPTASLRIVQRGICRHRHVAATTSIHHRIVMTRVSRGMQDNQVVEERVFFLAGAVDGDGDGRTPGKDADGSLCVLAVFSTAYFLQVGRRNE